jgi:hypothetical protein
MVLEERNIKKCLVISDAISNIALPKFHNTVKSLDFTDNHPYIEVGTFSGISSGDSGYETLASFRKSPASFVIYICQIFRPCQSLLRICSQTHKVRRVQTYSLRNRLNLSLTSRTGRSQNLFAELNPFRIFVMRQNRIARFTKYIKAFGRISVALLLRVVAVLSQELGVRPLFMQLTDLCSTKCDRTTQAVRRIIVPLLHPYLNYRTFSIFLTRKSSIVSNLFQRVRSAISLRCSVSFSVCS